MQAPIICAARLARAIIPARMTPYPIPSHLSRLTASQWASRLGAFFPRVAVFALNGASAETVAVSGMRHQALGESISLLDKNPLRWAIDAGSTLVGSGKSPGGASVAYALGLEAPRAYAIMPLAMPGGIVGLAYADSPEAPFALSQVSAALAYCQASLAGAGATLISEKTHAERARRRGPQPSSARRLAIEITEEPAREPEELAEGEHDLGAFTALVEAAMTELSGEELAAPAQAAPSEEPDVEEELPFADESEVICLMPKPPLEEPLAPRPAVVTTKLRVARTLRREKLRAAMTSAGALAAVAATILFLLSPATTAPATPRSVVVPAHASLAEIAVKLQNDGVIRSAVGFRWLARLGRVDRAVRAGTYLLSPNDWAWQHLRELCQARQVPPPSRLASAR